MDGQIKLARLLTVEATQAAEQITSLRRSQFQARLGERRASVLGTRYWSELRGDLPRDIARLSDLGAELLRQIRATPAWAWMLVGLSVAILSVLWIWIARLLLQLTATHVPAGRLRRSVHALALVALAVAMPGLITELVIIGLTWAGDLSENTTSLIGGLVGIVCFGGYVAGLDRALLSPDRPSWRLPAIPDTIARGMRRLPISLGVLTVTVWLAVRLPALLNTAVTTTIAINGAVALALAVYLGAATLRLGRLLRQARPECEQGPAPPRPLWL